MMALHSRFLRGRIEHQGLPEVEHLMFKADIYGAEVDGLF